MSRKLYAALLPLAAVVAFVAVPAAAQAAPEWEACKAKTGGKFTTTACTTQGTPKAFEWETVGTLGSAVLTNTKNVPHTEAILSIPDQGWGVRCTTMQGESQLWNEDGVGRGISEIEFTGCKGESSLDECTVAEPIVFEASTTLKEEEGKIYNWFSRQVDYELGELKLSGSRCEAPGTYPVEGTTGGEMTAHGNKQKFSGETLKLGGLPGAFQAETEQELSPSKGGVRVS